MTTVQLYFRQNLKSLSVAVESYDIGVDILRYFVEDLLSDGTIGFAFAIKNREDADFPTLHFQQCENAFFLQVYATASVATDGTEGWHCLVESDDIADADVGDLVTLATGSNDGEKHCPVRFAEGVLFSTRLLVSTGTVKTALSHYPGEKNIREWLRRDKWVNLGLL